MGNFYTDFVDGTTKFRESDMDIPLQGIDRVLGYHHNFIIHTDGLVEYDILTGKLSWSSTIRIYFNNSSGNIVSNTIAAGSVTLTDNQFAYCDLNETDTTVITVSNAAVTLASASNTISTPRIVLGYRNTASDQYFPVHLPLFDGTKTAEITTTDDTVTTLISHTLTEGQAYFIEAKVVAREGDVDEVSAYVRRALVYRQTAGSATLQGTDVDVWTLEASSASGLDVEIDVSGNDVRLRITGDNASNPASVYWKGEMKLIEV